MRATNLDGSRRLFDAVAERRVPSLIYASSVGTYAPASKSRRHDEVVAGHRHCHEHVLEAQGGRRDDARRRRARSSAATGGPHAHEPRVPAVGGVGGAPAVSRFAPAVASSAPAPLGSGRQSSDVPGHPRRRHRERISRGARRDVAGAFNVAAEPTLTMRRIAEAVGGRVVPMPERVLRAAVALSYAARFQPSEPGWLDMAVQAPLMDSSRARRELGWAERTSAVDALTELLDGIGDGAGYPTAPLKPVAGPCVASTAAEHEQCGVVVDVRRTDQLRHDEVADLLGITSAERDPQPLQPDVDRLSAALDQAVGETADGAPRQQFGGCVDRRSRQAKADRFPVRAFQQDRVPSRVLPSPGAGARSMTR